MIGKDGLEGPWRASDYDSGIFLNTQKKIMQLTIVNPYRDSNKSRNRRVH
jgi:hypothetical protein